MEPNVKNVGVNHGPDLNFTTMTATVDAYTQLVHRQQPFHVVIMGFLVAYIDGAVCYSVDPAL